MRYVPTPPKTCELCGITYERKVGSECVKQYLARRFCSNACGNEVKFEANRKAAAERRDAIIEDLEWILGTDNPDRVTRRLGYSDVENLRMVLRRWGREDLANRLLERVA
jgi:hypothetical protein